MYIIFNEVTLITYLDRLVKNSFNNNLRSMRKSSKLLYCKIPVIIFKPTK